MSDQFSFDDDPPTVRLKSAWGRVLRRLEAEVPPTWFSRFIKPLTPHRFEDHRVVILAPGNFVHDWVRSKYHCTMQQMLSDELGEAIELELVTEARGRPTDVAPPTPPRPTPQPLFTPCERFRFDTFVVGQSNRMAHAGSVAVADQPGHAFNPLFIYGGSGLGKTHLLHAIAQKILARDPAYRMVYITAQQFAEEFIEALKGGRIEQFRRAQRSVQMWLVDDIQFIAGKDKTMEEVFHTFNHLHGQGKQIVLASDRPPRDLHLMDERLRSRFEAGLVADIQSPDTETRSAILLSKAKDDGIDLPTSIAMYLAEQVPGNIRVLEGCLVRFSAEASIDDASLTIERAEHLVERYYRQTSRRPSASEIFSMVAARTAVPVESIRSRSRKAPIVRARQMVVYLMREILGDSWTSIGDEFDMDHTSMMYAYQKLAADMSQDAELRDRVLDAKRNLYPED